MIRSFFMYATLLLSAGCACNPDLEFTRRADTTDNWSTNYLLDANPGNVDTAYLKDFTRVVEEDYWQYAQVEGITWPPWRSDASKVIPDQWSNGGDTALFTGYALSAFSFKYGTTRNMADLDSVLITARGLHLLTNVTGTPGVVARCAFPANIPAKFNYPDWWGHRIAKGFVKTGPANIADPINGGTYPQMTYYTRGTRDQLTGMVLGLATAWKLCDPAIVPAAHKAKAELVRKSVALTMEGLHAHLVAHNWKIRDENGRNDTSADSVKGLLKAQFLALYSQTCAVTNPSHQAEALAGYHKEFDAYMDLSNVLVASDRFNAIKGYYGFNLRAARSLTIFMLDPDRATRVAQYYDTNVWKFVARHQNAWFAVVRYAFRLDQASLNTAITSMKSLSLKPLRNWSSPLFDQEQKPNVAAAAANCTYLWALPAHLRKPTQYFTWQKEPWDVGSGINGDWDKEGLGEATGLDVILPYWMARYYRGL